MLGDTRTRDTGYACGVLGSLQFCGHYSHHCLVARARVAELNTLDAQGWELAGIATQPQAVHFYFADSAAPT
jgi:hypothetical protein